MAVSRLLTGHVPSRAITAARGVERYARSDSALRRVVTLTTSESIAAPMFDRLMSSDNHLASKFTRVITATLEAQGKPIPGSFGESCDQLGYEQMRNMALLSALVIVLEELAPRTSLRLDSLLEQACAMASAARSLAPSDPHAYACALLANIGIAPLALSERTSYESVLASSLGSGVPVADVELSAVGCHHGQVGALILAHYGFPEPYRQAANEHCVSTGSPTEVAERLVHQFGYDGGFGSSPSPLDLTELKPFGVDAGKIEAMALQVAQASALVRKIIA